MEDPYYDALRQCGIRYANEMNYRIAGYLEENNPLQEYDLALDSSFRLHIEYRTDARRHSMDLPLCNP